MTIIHLRTILASPAINIAGLAKEVGISRRFMLAIRDGERNLTPRMAERIDVAVKQLIELLSENNLSRVK
jgi:plasmid maintenance system antidote protein VapI